MSHTCKVIFPVHISRFLTRAFVQGVRQKMASRQTFFVSIDGVEDPRNSVNENYALNRVSPYPVHSLSGASNPRYPSRRISQRL